ncbi:MAG: hypothetical protein GXO90_11925 [FCB group bacterium]|nr:hypothetical protein [FCB group bacterium]
MRSERILSIFFLMGLLFGQEKDASPYSYALPLVQFPQATTDNTTRNPRERITLEGVLNPDDYVLGPGDVLGINIVFTESWSGEIPVSPTGDLLIPGIGVLPVAGLTLSAAGQKIRGFILESYQNALVSVTLTNIRTFRLLILGAVIHPGFVDVTPVDRVLGIVGLAGGLHKFADSDRILIKHRNGEEEVISLKDYLVQGDESQNPKLSEGDKITVPFQEQMAEMANKFVTPTATPVSVSGFVNIPGAYQFMYGYSVGDYLGIAGGVSEDGSLHRGILYRNQQALPLNPDEFVAPGDRIYIGENFRSRILGKSSLMQTVTALTSLYLTYLSRIKK